MQKISKLIKTYLQIVAAFTAIILLSFLYFYYDPINNLLFPKCPLYSTTGILCPGCGSQRATHSLLHFDLIGVLKNNLLFLPAFVLIAYHFAIRIINRILTTNFTSILDRSKTPIIVLIVVILFWALRNLPYAVFDVLRPV